MSSAISAGSAIVSTFAAIASLVATVVLVVLNCQQGDEITAQRQLFYRQLVIENQPALVFERPSDFEKKGDGARISMRLTNAGGSAENVEVHGMLICCARVDKIPLSKRVASTVPIAAAPTKLLARGRSTDVIVQIDPGPWDLLEPIVNSSQKGRTVHAILRASYQVPPIELDAKPKYEEMFTAFSYDTLGGWTMTTSVDTDTLIGVFHANKPVGTRRGPTVLR